MHYAFSWVIPTAALLQLTGACSSGTSPSSQPGSAAGGQNASAPSGGAGTTGNSNNNAGATQRAAGKVCSKDCSAANKTCDPLTGFCVGCVIDNDCPRDNYCDSGICWPIETCTVDSQCNHACNQTTHQCVDCNVRADCSGAYCSDEHKCVPYTPCSSTGTCTFGICDVSTERCVTCTETAGCGARESCVGNSCEKTCKTDGECPTETPRCNPNGGFCAQCATHADCPDKYYCGPYGVCKPSPCAAGKSTCSLESEITCSPDGDRILSTKTCSPWPCITENGVGACQDENGVPPLYLIDDFGDCDANIITYFDGGDHTQVGRVGGWAGIGTATFTAGLPPNSSFIDQSCGVFVSGHCDNLANCNLGTYATLAKDGDTEYWYDLSRFGGFRITYEANVPLDVTVVGTAIITKIRSSTAAVAGLPPTTAGTSTKSLGFLKDFVDTHLGGAFVGFEDSVEVSFTVSSTTTQSDARFAIHRLELYP